MISSKYDIAIIGGGILGLATAKELSESNPRLSICVIEKENRLASHQTGHNSGVIHSGLYYRPGSHKATTCVAGSQALKAFCDENDIKYNLIGKVVVATEEDQIAALNTLHERGIANGVEGLERIGPERLREIEPHAAGIQALLCPQTGIIDYTEVAHAYAKVARKNGVNILTETKVLDLGKSEKQIHIETNQGDIHADYLINCAGLYSDVIASKIETDVDVRIVPFRGEYYKIAPEKHHLVKTLIYPVPNPAFPFLGVHFTRMIGGGVEAGPNAVLAYAREGYSHSDVNIKEFIETLSYSGFWVIAKKYWKTGLEEFWRSISKEAFTAALQKLIPEIQESDLIPGGAGVRAQAVDRNGTLLDDFSIVQSERAFHVLNAPSPAATASLAIAKQIVDGASKSFNTL